MKTTLKKWHIALISFLTLFIAVFASLFSLRADTVDEETGEILTDNWELGVVFYDSSVDNGKTPLTELNWDASDGSYKEGTPRVITVQINYKNSNVMTTYQPGELEISIPNILYGYNSAQWQVKTTYIGYELCEINLGANDPRHEKYDWTYLDGTTLANYNIKDLFFYNTYIIEEKANFEGSLQIQYKLVPAEEWASNSSPLIEKYEDECTHGYNCELEAVLSYSKINENQEIEEIQLHSNKLKFNYIRTYIHPWQKVEYTLDKTAKKITSLDGFPAGDYIWIQYEFHIEDGTTYKLPNYPNITPSELYVVDPDISDCLVISSDFKTVIPDNGVYKLYQSGSKFQLNTKDRYYITFYVGYPKSIYNEEKNNLNIKNTGQLYIKYVNSTEFEYVDDAEVSINLNDYKFTYSGNLYGISKKIFDKDMDLPDATGKLYYESLIGEDLQIGSGGKFYNLIYPSAVYTGNSMDVKFGDDLLLITDNNGEYRKLEDNEYYFSEIRFPATIKNGNGQPIPNNKYNCELWIRHADSNNYIKYEEFTNQEKIWKFTKDNKVVGYQFIIKNMSESIKSQNMYASNYKNLSLSAIQLCDLKNIAANGKIYNFSFIQVYINNILQNAPDISSYANFVTKEDIANYDLETYGSYMQRSCAYLTYKKYQIQDPRNFFFATKDMSNAVQNAEEEKFTGSATISATFFNDDNVYNYSYTDHEIATYSQSIPDEKRTVGYEFYDLLPKGMEIESTPEEIINSMKINLGYYIIIKKDGSSITDSSKVQSFFREHATIQITHNWNNTNRTHLHVRINFEDEPLIIIKQNKGGNYPLTFSYKWSVSYDAYLEYGNVYTNFIHGEFYNREYSSPLFGLGGSPYPDNGSYNNGRDPEQTDLNNNGNTSEKLTSWNDSITISSVASTHQDVTTFVRTDYSNYSTGIVDTSNNSEYEYKLRVRTGAADVTNLILYTNIEEAQSNRTRWKGEFLGINTTYAVSKGYIVKPYYSENPAAKNLYNENGSINSDWKEYVQHEEEVIGNGLAITFNENCKTYNYSDYLYIYYYYNDVLYRSDQYYGTTLAGKTIEIPATECYFYWYTDNNSNSAYGFSIDNIKPIIMNVPVGNTGYSLPSYTPIEISGTIYPETSHSPYENNSRTLWHYTSDNNIVQEYVEGIDQTKVKSLAFEYLDANGNPAILPANSLTYVLIKMKSPIDENIKTLARMDCWTQWNALDEFDQPVDFITGINSNVVKVALPNSVKTDDMPSVSLRFTKEIQGIDSQFKNMKLDKAAQQTFMIRLTSLTANDDGTYNQLTALLKSNQELIISQIPVGTYLLEELGDNYFDFVGFSDNNDPEIIIEGVTFERTDQGYIITVSESLTENIEFNIKVTNEIEAERFYEDKDNKENLFLKNKIEENE